MSTNWYKIALFCLVSFLLGWFVGRHLCGGHRGCCDEAGMCHEGGCGHGDRSSCKGDGHGHGEAREACCHGEGHGEGHQEHIHAIVHGLKDAGFQGDTVIKEGDCTITIGLHGGKTEVKVEMNDSMKVEEKTVEMHGH